MRAFTTEQGSRARVIAKEGGADEWAKFGLKSKRSKLSPAPTMRWEPVFRGESEEMTSYRLFYMKRGYFMKNERSKKLVLAGVLTALAVVGSLISIPVGASKCSPVQHLVNVVSAVLLGPGWSLLMAFTAALIRNLLGIGTLFAFPGSMCGAYLAGILYKYSKKLPLALAGELVGTGIIGAILTYPIATFIMGKETAIFAMVIPFSVSSLGGVIISAVILYALKRTKKI